MNMFDSMVMIMFEINNYVIDMLTRHVDACNCLLALQLESQFIVGLDIEGVTFASDAVACELQGDLQASIMLFVESFLIAYKSC